VITVDERSLRVRSACSAPPTTPIIVERHIWQWTRRGREARHIDTWVHAEQIACEETTTHQGGISLAWNVGRPACKRAAYVTSRTWRHMLMRHSMAQTTKQTSPLNIFLLPLACNTSTLSRRVPLVVNHLYSIRASYDINLSSSFISTPCTYSLFQFCY